MRKLNSNANRGFTLIELMIVVAVIAVLAAISYPSYRDHVIKTRRAAAAACMMEAAQFMERYYTTNMTYSGATMPTLGCLADTSRFYTIGLSAAATATAFTMRAVPTSTQNDSKCGTISIDQKGTKAKTGTAGNVSECF